MRLDEELDRAIGDGPAHRPVDDRIEAGRRLVRRRRTLASGAAALAVVAVVGGAWALTGGDGGSPRSQPPLAGDPSAGAESDPAAPAELSFSERDCSITGDGVAVLDEIEISAGGTGLACQRASAYDDDGTERWILVSSPAEVDGERLFDVDGPVEAEPGSSFESWVAEHVTTSTPAAGPEVPRSFPAPVEGWVSFQDDGRLVPGDGVAVLDQTTEVDLKDFILEPGDRAAAAQVVVDGRVFFVLARDAAGFVDLIAHEPDTDGETLAQFLDRVAEQYDSGAGSL